MSCCQYSEPAKRHKTNVYVTSTLRLSCQLVMPRRFGTEFPLRHNWRTLETSTTAGGSGEAAQSFYVKFRRWWKGPTFKYWFLGGSAFTAWLSYYSIKAYRKTRVEVVIPPAMPSHFIVPRVGELKKIRSVLDANERIGGKLRFVTLQGPTGYGKSLLAHSFGQQELENLQSFRFSIPKSRTLVFLNAGSNELFLASLKGFASKLNIRPSEVKEKCDAGTLKDLTFEEKCNLFLELIQDKMTKHPDWVIVFDNMSSTTPMELRNLLHEWFLDDQNAAKWSKGTVIVTDDSSFALPKHTKQVLKMKKGLSMSDSKHLIQELVSMSPETTYQSDDLEKLINFVEGHPLGLTCAGIILKHRLLEKPMGSVNSCIKTLCNDLEKQIKNTVCSSRFGPVTDGTPESNVLIATEVLVAMAWNIMKTGNPYIVHCFDLLSNCRPGMAVPSFLILRYLKTPLFQLPPLESNHLAGLNSLFNKGKSEDAGNELEPEGSALSNRRIVNWVYKAETWLQETWQVIKELYELYSGAMNLPEEDDGLGFLKENELVLTHYTLPGDVKSFVLHPCVYMVARQNFITHTAPLLENWHLKSEQMKFHNQSWYRKMHPFEPSVVIEKYRKSLGFSPENSMLANTIVQGYNAPVFDFTGILLNRDETIRSTYESGNSTSRFLHIQAHLSRVLHALKDGIEVAPQTMAGKTSSRLMSSHLEYILQSQPTQLIGIQSRIDSLLALATVAFSVENDARSAKGLYESILNLHQQHQPDNVLQTASILSQIASMEILLEQNENGKTLLEQAMAIYESHRKKFGEYRKPYEFGKCLSSLGIVCGSLGEKQRSKELLERGLMLQQAGAPDLSDSTRGKHFGGEFASSLTDLGHAYIAIGLPLYGKKILDLALVAHKNIHGDAHPEVSRTLSLLSVAHLMQGHNEESRRLRKEAGKVNADINMLPSY